MDTCNFCKKYHPINKVCNEWIEEMEKGKSFCYSCWTLTFSKEHDCVKCGLSKGSWDVDIFGGNRMEYRFEIIKGVEGQCLSFGDADSGYRLSGPKPWGGGNVIKKFPVNIDDLKVLHNNVGAAIDDLEHKENLKPGS